MIVAREDASHSLTATGAWGRETLDQILRRHALAQPDKLALADFGDRAEWTSGTAHLLSYAQLDRRVETFASFFHMLGLLPDTVIGVQMPATTDAAIVLLALSRAGLVAAPMPLALRDSELKERLSALGAKAIITLAEVLDDKVGERLRDVAAELFNIRFVFCAGDKVPDGLVELDRVFAEAGDLGDMPEITRRGNPADHSASVAWVLARRDGRSGPAVLPRSHNHWLAAGLMTSIEAAIDGKAVLISPFALSGLKGIGVGLMPWLITGATLCLGMPTSVDRIVEEAAIHGATHILVPAGLARHLADRMVRAGVDATLLVVGEGVDGDPDDLRGAPSVDVTVLGEFGVVARRRTSGDVGTIPVGAVRAPSGSLVAPVLIETRLLAAEKKTADSRLASGELAVRGAMVPDQPWTGSTRDRTGPISFVQDGFVPTGIRVTLSAVASDHLVLNGPVEDRAGAGQLEIDLEDLDKVLLSVGSVSDAAALVLPGAPARLGAAVVPKPGATFDSAGYLAALGDLQIGVHKVPEAVFEVPAIARATSGRVMRTGMASRLASDA